ncbi:LBF_2017 N-terminal domain-containing protein [Leptospira harrisiae]|uniref:Ig-like domain-containing protein n=1 Tax=Leptospira harrisiae TaxID=2023189 RepID=A0A2N0AP48_9LEPT|nr:hypothetical protein [Leptospira harrisiae]PJZ86096.1 hypothetical protein CH364_07940 [Leptospira harrisiae]PKA09658.1 hypothetical protein CH366_08215 [Leptospira harrisiae]
MNPFIRFKLFVIFVVFMIPNIPIVSESKTIQFALEPDREDIIQYEFELWKTPNLDLEIPFRVVSNPGKIQLFIPNGYDYFRIRAVAKRQVRGFWTDLYAVSSFGKPKPKEPTKIIAKKENSNEVLIPISNSAGTNHFYLTENKIQVKPVLSQPMKTSVRYRLNGGPWFVTKQPELTFSKDGDYKLEYQVTNELGVSDSIQVWEFRVDNTPPKTEFHWHSPLFKKSSQLFVGLESNLELTSVDAGSGLDSIRFRTSCGKKNKTDWYLWDSKTSWKDTIQNCTEDIELEISATDKLGNEEIPQKIQIKHHRKEPN